MLQNPLAQPGSPLNCKRMYRQAVGSKLLYSANGLFHIFLRLPRQPKDQVHIDIIKAFLPRQPKCLNRLRHSMPTTDQIKGFLLHRLWIDRNSRHTITLHHTQFLCRNTIRAPCFYRKLPHLRPVKRILKLQKKPLQFLWFQCSRRAAANINAVQNAVCAGFFYEIDFLFHGA